MTKNVLVIKLRGIGDAVLATPAIQVLKQSGPEVQVTAVMSSPADQVLMHSPYVDRIILWRKENEVSLVLSLRRIKFDSAVNFHASLRSALLAYLSGARVRVIHDHGGHPYFTTLRVPEPTVRKSAMERDLDAVRALKIPVLPGLRPMVFLSEEERDWAGSFLRRQNAPVQALVTVAIGASAPSKRWPPERFGKLCAQISSGQEARVLLLTTSADETLLSAFFRECAEEKVIHIHDLTIRQVMALIRASRVFIGNDSGIKHLACALGTPTLTLFGPEDLEEWHPYKPEEGHEVLIKDVPCRGRGCGLLVCEHLTCLREISVEEVWDRVQAILSRPFHERA